MKNLYMAYKQCIRNKKNTTNALKFELNREANLLELLNELKSGEYKISRHICFVVKNPAPREVFASDFRDRIVQHLLCNEIEEIFEKQFLDSSFANRIGRGTHRAFKRARFFITRGGVNRQRLFYLKMDIKSFYNEILNKKDGFIQIKDIPKVSSYLGHCIHANSFNLLKKIKNS